MERETIHSPILNEIKDYTALGRLLRDARLSQRMSLRKVAGEVGISAAYLHALENAKNPKTGKPSTPKSDVLVKLFYSLKIIPTPEIFLPTNPIQFVQLSGEFLTIAALSEREKAADMVRAGEIFPQGQNEIFNYRLELAASYTSAAVAIEAVRDKLEKEIQELTVEYQIEEGQLVNRPEVEAIQQNPPLNLRAGVRLV